MHLVYIEKFMVLLLVQAVNATNGPSHDAGTLTGLKNDGEDGGDKVIHRTTRRISLTCRLVTKVHKHLIKI